MKLTGILIVLIFLLLFNSNYCLATGISNGCNTSPGVQGCGSVEKKDCTFNWVDDSTVFSGKCRSDYEGGCSCAPKINNGNCNDIVVNGVVVCTGTTYINNKPVCGYNSWTVIVSTENDKFGYCCCAYIKDLKLVPKFNLE